MPRKQKEKLHDDSESEEEMEVRDKVPLKEKPTKKKVVMKKEKPMKKSKRSLHPKLRAWIDRLKEYAKENGVSYKNAMVACSKKHKKAE